ncbi:MAG: ribbon-helix-helix protein, CopG family [Zoogloeaceae bacterium]|uniref:ribbon-helix-helix protein, CopG family n=1 Tax=Denitromonas sp. TaxID=2734609 RepID=UPI00336D8481|nr:ribbon-helix-helix protein, CopG family [Zoogloeaceae bacterium]
MERQQINVRLSDALAEQIDRKRIAMQASLGRIPTRSEVLRLALEAFLAKDEDGPMFGIDRRSSD